MRFPIRAAAATAVALSICAASGLAAPSIASESDAAPSVPYTEHEATALTAASLGLNDLRDTTPANQPNAPAPVAIHALAQLPVAADADEDADAAGPRRSLADLVSDYSAAETPDEETDCLARAVYYESKGEPLAGQLTVADVILNRAHSGGRFPASVCGVVRQAGQFSFVHGGFIPTPPAGSRDWRTAVAIAQMAMRNLADGAAPRALFFHARSVRPGWRLTRVAAIGNHVFYR
jgi:spore germination cell wall hydrolase CwlJ-like protein